MPDDIDVRTRIMPFRSSAIVRRVGDLIATAVIRGDVVHVTGDIQFVALAVARRRSIVTMHDCGLAYGPNGMTRRIFRSLWVRRPVRHAGRVVAVSDFTRRQLVELTGLPVERIDVIPTTIDDSFTPVPIGDPQRAVPVVLCFAATPNKNVERVIEAVTGLRMHLNIVGRLSEATTQRLAASALSWSNHIGLSDEALRQQYIEADLVLFPSTYEGFGMPIVEGQATGRPVVTSDRAPMNEVAGGAACLVDPDDPASIRAGVERVLNDAVYRRDLVVKGYKNRERFRPEVAARAYAQIYREMVG